MRLPFYSMNQLSTSKEQILKNDSKQMSKSIRKGASVEVFTTQTRTRGTEHSQTLLSTLHIESPAASEGVFGLITTCASRLATTLLVCSTSANKEPHVLDT